ncbi:MAG TPA: PEP-CTERM sorting domain-containing protein [Steroidobacteraceae bacterium]|jgi:hypothetical protein|nr:PEP-CTERM sorting domain-containing protein [Steroidobacteraceae bacterium]
MKSAQLLATLLAAACSPLFAAQPSVFDISGTVDIFNPDTGAATSVTDNFSGTLDINTATGAVTGADIQFGTPGYGLTIPAMTLVGYETAPGPVGSHLYDIEICAQAVCSTGWFVNMTVDVLPTDPTLVGYAGGKINNVGFFYVGVQDAWGACPDLPGYNPSTCGGITLKSGGGGGKTGVPEPASALLLLSGLAAGGLRRRRRRAG